VVKRKGKKMRKREDRELSLNEKCTQNVALKGEQKKACGKPAGGWASSGRPLCHNHLNEANQKSLQAGGRSGRKICMADTKDYPN
jgi:hypothetical protein